MKSTFNSYCFPDRKNYAVPLHYTFLFQVLKLQRIIHNVLQNESLAFFFFAFLKEWVF